jgi:ribosome-associated protein
MTIHKKGQKGDEPLHIHLGSDDDEEFIDQAKPGTEEYDDGEVEVIRPHGRRAEGAYTRGRGLHSQPAPVEEEEELPPSKTKIKKQMHELRDLGKELTELGKDQLAQLEIPENLREAISEMKNINKFGAQRRQIQYIGKLMREVDPGPILAKLDVWKGRSQQHTAYMHLLERWRDRLMEGEGSLTELLASHPDADAQRLRTLIRNAHKELEQNKTPKNYREIFQVLREIIPEPS